MTQPIRVFTFGGISPPESRLPAERDYNHTTAKARDLLGDAPEWHEHAVCATTDPDAFFPEKGGSTREAKRICARCEVKTECLDYALRNDERFGIWGGKSERELRKLKRRAGA